jgi:hypothetical protein
MTGSIHRAGPAGRARAILLAAVLMLAARPLLAQGNYEIQVYGSETMPTGVTMFELHSNFTLDGARTGTRPSNHALHETVEITHGFNSWFEVGYYVFTSARSGTGLEFVGTHLRPRVRAPESWNWPVGVSISQEIGYQREVFTEDTWSYELRPIIDKSFGPLYLSLNPVLEAALAGPNKDAGFDFAPNVAANVDVAPRVNLGLEYYGGLGPVRHWDSPSNQEHMLFGALNYDFGPEWEFNFGVGRGLTSAGDRTLVKMIMGRRVGKVPS